MTPPADPGNLSIGLGSRQQAGQSRQGQQNCAGCYRLIVTLIAVLLLALFTVLAALTQPAYISYSLAATAVLLGTAIYLLYRLKKEIQLRLARPLALISEWSDKMNQGKLNFRISASDDTGYPNLIGNINNLSAKMLTLSTEMQSEVKRQTERSARKTHTLEVLYDVAASINISTSLEDLLLRFLPTLKEVMQAEAVTVRLASYDGQMRLIGSLGLEDHADEVETLVPVLHCMYSSALQEGELLSQDKILRCEIYPGQPFYGVEGIEMIAVPLQYRNKNLGVYNLFVKTPSLLEREDVEELLISIGRHLGIAVEKTYTEDESKRLSLYRERNLLSHELHDSLAQTLAALKFQIRGLVDSLKEKNYTAAEDETEQIRNGLDEAYAELRELIAHFRAPFDERGLIAAIESVIQGFRNSCDISIYFHNQWKETNFSSLREMQVLRIIQESLNNIKKHSQAHSVRILLTYDSNENFVVLIEDDGIGIRQPLLGGNPGEQVGLSIMKERAHRLGGDLTIESEPGEGTRIVLTISLDSQKDTQPELP